jgi:hypothetical protein
MWDQDIKSEINPVLNPRAAGPEGSLIGIPGILCLIAFSFVIDLCHSLNYELQNLLKRIWILRAAKFMSFLKLI